MLTVSYIAALFGFISTFYAVHCSKYTLAFVAYVATISAIVTTSVNQNTNTIATKTVLASIDVLCGVMLVIVCAFTIKMHTSCIGAFRILWLVTLISSSNTYDIFAKNATRSVFPSDVSLIAVIISSLFLLASAIYVKCRQPMQIDMNYEKHRIAFESTLVCGALLMRFREDIPVLQMFALYVWYLCCWISVIICAHAAQYFSIV